MSSLKSRQRDSPQTMIRSRSDFDLAVRTTQADAQHAATSRNTFGGRGLFFSIVSPGPGRHKTTPPGLTAVRPGVVLVSVGQAAFDPGF
jgi:hypothetical protein